MNKNLFTVMAAAVCVFVGHYASAVEFEASRSQKVVEQVLTIKSDQIPCEVVSNDNRYRKTTEGYSVELACSLNFYEFAREIKLKESSQLRR